MKRFLVILGLLAILASIPAASAQAPLLLNECVSSVDISENSGHERMTLSYIVRQVGENALQDSIFVYGFISGVSVYDQFGPLAYENENVGGFTRVRFNLRENLRVEDRSMVTVEFTKATSTAAGGYMYEIRYMWSTAPIIRHVIATLPEEYELSNTATPYTSISSEDGLRMRWWSGFQENNFYTAVTFARKSTAPENQEGGQPAAAPSPPYALLLVAVAISLALAGGLLKVSSMRQKKMPKEVRRPRALPREDVRRILGILTEHERKVIKELVKKDNLTQQALCDRTGIPKATMSRVLQRLEGKGMVSREGYGVSKRVSLTRWARRLRGR